MTIIPTTSLALFDLLEGDADLTDLLGIHTLQDGTTRAAIAHFFPQETIEPDAEPSGVEIIVWRSPMGTAAIPFETGEVDLRPTFRITVTQWEPLNDGDYNQAEVITRIQQLLPGANASDVTIDGLTTGLQQHIVAWTCPAASVSRP